MFDIEYIKDIIKRNFVAIFAILFGIGSFVLSGVYVYFNKCEEHIDTEVLCKSTNLELKEQEEKTEDFVKVDIKGAVKKSGVYELKYGSNIQDAISLAGGITSKGSTKNINLSKKLTDEMVIYVFTKDELNKKETANEVVCEVPKCECETIKVVECPSVNGNEGSTDKTGKVSLNKATKEELMTLDGIGESKALAIIDYREKNGDFEKIEDLMNVNGIADKAFEKIKDRITL